MPHATQLLSPCALEPVCLNLTAYMLQLLIPACSGAHRTQPQSLHIITTESLFPNQRCYMMQRRSHMLQLRSNTAKLINKLIKKKNTKCRPLPAKIRMHRNKAEKEMGILQCVCPVRFLDEFLHSI